MVGHNHLSDWHRFFNKLVMKEKNYTGIVPGQETGKAIDAESSIELADTNEATKVYNRAKARLINVNEWHMVASGLSAKFQLVDKTGLEVNRPAEKGDYFKIDIPGPGTKSGEGYDWVQIEALESTKNGEVESFGLRVRPTENPQNSNHDVAHFYSPESTSSFTITRENNKVTAAIYDRNTKPNKEAHNAIDKVRDALVGAAGIFGFSKVQWQHLAEGLLKNN